MVNFGPLVAEIGSLVWGNWANFNGFRVLASLLHRRRSMEANQTLHDVWPCPGLVHHIYIFGGSWPVTEFTLRPSLALSYIGSISVRHWEVGMSQTLWRGIFTRQGGHPVRHWAVKLSSWDRYGCSLINETVISVHVYVSTALHDWLQRTSQMW